MVLAGGLKIRFVSWLYVPFEIRTPTPKLRRESPVPLAKVVAYRGEEIAEIRPIEANGNGLDKSLKRLEDRGRLSRARTPTGPLKPLVRKPGALARFLDSRE